MRARASRFALILYLSLFVFITPVSAEVVSVTLDGVTTNTCDTDWQEGSCTLHVIDTIMGDYTPPGFCIFFPQPEGLALMGARLEVDVSAIVGVEWVEVDLREVSGDFRTRIFLYEEGATNYFQFVGSSYDGGATDQTLPLFFAGEVLAKVVVSGHEALIQEIRLYGNTLVDLANPSWGMLKAHW